MNNNCKTERESFLRTILPAIIMFVAGLSMILCAAFLGGREKAVEVMAGTAEVRRDPIYVTSTEYYVIRKNENGKISVYLSDGTLYKSIDVYVWSLSGKDRELLEIGIMAESDEELACYLEGLAG